MELNIITPQGSSTISEVDSISLPGSEGRFMVLSSHAPLLASITKGEVQYSQKGHKHTIMAANGVVEIRDNVINIITEQ